MRYLIDDEVVSKEKFDERLEEAVSNYVDENYDDLIDECYPEVKIGCCTFYPSQILRECDPIAYRCGVSDEESYKRDEVNDELECGREVELDGATFKIEEEDEEE